MEYQDAPEAQIAPNYIKRALADVVARATTPVVILEGAPGTGKTTLVKNDVAFREYHYVTLADEEEHARASEHPGEWAASLPRPVVIDDAHRIGSLLEVVQQLASKKSAKRPDFVLVASRALRSERTKGAKLERFTLFPFTQAELYGRAGCVVDDLFDGAVARGFYSFPTRSDIRTKMRIGGFPHRATHPARELSRRRRSDPLFQDEFRLLRETDIGPETSIDQLIEKSILEELLISPGLSLGVDKLARSCYIDASTLCAHLESLEDRFLVHCLAMLDRTRLRRRSFTKTRIHPVDITLAIEEMQIGGHDIAGEPPMFSKVLKTLCVNQLVPAAQWAKAPTACHHWRKFDRRMREVDLVLVRDDRLVGITVRNSLAARPDTIGALRFLAEDKRFARGFIIYMGKFTRQLTENIWALPVSALWEEAAFCAEEDTEKATSETADGGTRNGR